MSKKLPIVAIVGRANVGKSSLFNAVLGRREAIVAREAGTTRDSIAQIAEFRGHYFWLVDTAGMKSPEDDFELTIQQQIAEAAASADLIWVVVEANAPVTDEDRRVAKMAHKSKKPTILVANKIDKANDADLTLLQKLGVKEIFATSTTQNRGTGELLDQTAKLLPRAKQKISKDIIKTAILGRPNVGKSSIFNALVKKQKAIVAARAGTTRDVNRQIIKYKGQEIELMDTAGIRRSGKIEKGVERFSVLRALSAIEEADVCLLVMDSGELNVALDQKIAGLVKEAGKGLILVVSKWDTYLEKTTHTTGRLSAQIAVNFEFVPWVPLIFTSSLTGQNVSRIFELITAIYSARQTKIKTPLLNRWLAQATIKHAPTGLKNSSPKLNYIVQEQDNPNPTFKIYGKDARLIHFSYKRYLEKELRREFGYGGTPIKFWFFNKE